MASSSGNSEGKNEAVLNVTKGKYVDYCIRCILWHLDFCMCIWSSSV